MTNVILAISSVPTTATAIRYPAPSRIHGKGMEAARAKVVGWFAFMPLNPHTGGTCVYSCTIWSETKERGDCLHRLPRRKRPGCAVGCIRRHKYFHWPAVCGERVKRRRLHVLRQTGPGASQDKAKGPSCISLRGRYRNGPARQPINAARPGFVPSRHVSARAPLRMWSGGSGFAILVSFSRIDS